MHSPHHPPVRGGVAQYFVEKRGVAWLCLFALLAWGSGPIKGFAVVHCLGILTSMFSAVMFSRGLVNLWYGRQRKLKTVSIGQIWKPAEDKPADTAEAVEKA